MKLPNHWPSFNAWALIHNSLSSVIVMASNAKRSRVEDNDSDDSESSFELFEERTGGMESGEESELDRLLIDESEISR